MTSILTNVAAMSALQTLRGIGQDMEATQASVSSGLRVGSASDNAAYWSIATTMRSDNMALSAVQDALGLGAAKVDTAYAGMESAIEVVKEIKAKLVAATEDGVDKKKIQEEITQLQSQLSGIAEASSFSGENWLQADLADADDSVTKDVVGSFVRDASGSVSVKKISYELNSSTVLFDTQNENGILDKKYNIAPNTVTLNVNVNGVNEEHTVKTTTIDELIKSSAVFEGNYAIVTTAATGGAAAASYVKVDGAWVQAEAADDGADGQELAATTSGTITGIDEDNWVVDLGNTVAVGEVTEAKFSVAEIALVDDSGVDNVTAEELDQLIQAVDLALTDMTSAAADLGSISMRIGLQEEFVSKLTDSIDSGVGRLVDADMNEESTKLKALQTQQQLAIQSLSIANSDSQNILTLFR
jgi:flagellin